MKVFLLLFSSTGVHHISIRIVSLENKRIFIFFKWPSFFLILTKGNEAQPNNILKKKTHALQYITHALQYV